ncbi:DinB family protein [Bacillus pretiosus]|uniref:DinB family protein n=1 Tax=Bacillus pretiosus TaxID=2983392 RepID=UPI003D65445E
MSEVKNIISNFSHYSSWLSTLEEINETLWSKPIAESKWSVSEIIAHIMNWDNYLLTEIFPSVQNEQGMEFPDFDTYNQKASNYAKSGVSQSKLLEEAKNTRELLVKELNELPTEKLKNPLTANGVTHCPNTGTPYSLIYIVKEFTDHDNHHKRQIIQLLRENNLS